MDASCATVRLARLTLKIILVLFLAFWNGHRPLQAEVNLTAQELEDSIRFWSPSQKVRIKFGEKIEFLGYDLTLLASQPMELTAAAPEFGHNDKFRITYYWRPLQEVDGKYQALIRFKGKYGNFNNDHLIGNRAILHQPQRGQEVGKTLYSTYTTDQWKIGEVVKEGYEVTVPIGIGPGLYQMQIEVVGANNDYVKGEFVKFGNFSIVSRPFASQLEDDLLQRLFGPNIWNIKRGITLGPGSVVAIELEDVPPSKGLGIISYTNWSGDIWQDKRIVQLIVEDEKGKEFIYNLKQGVDTASAWIDNPKERGRFQHHKAKVATSRPVRRGNAGFQAHTYYTRVDFSEVSKPAKLTLIYTDPEGIIIIQAIVLITPG